MRKIIIGVLCLMLMPFALAENYVGDNIEFNIEIPLENGGCNCNIGDNEFCNSLGSYCTERKNEYECSLDEFCSWEGCNLNCDLDDSDNEVTYSFLGYALKDPEGIIREQQTPTQSCEAENPTVTYEADKSGIWKFCAIKYAYHISYNQECLVEKIDCEKEVCQEIIVESCNPDELFSSVDTMANNYFDSWLEGW